MTVFLPRASVSMAGAWRLRSQVVVLAWPSALVVVVVIG
jgi:hypothetical protein